jgi:hypothetical protein
VTFEFNPNVQNADDAKGDAATEQPSMPIRGRRGSIVDAPMLEDFGDFGDSESPDAVPAAAAATAPVDDEPPLRGLLTIKCMH